MSSNYLNCAVDEYGYFYINKEKSTEKRKKVSYGLGDGIDTNLRIMREGKLFSVYDRHGGLIEKFGNWEAACNFINESNDGANLELES